MADSLWVRRDRLQDRARAFHRAMERLFHAMRTDGRATGDPIRTYQSCRRRWRELHRAAAYASAEDNVFTLYHLANARALWHRIQAEAPVARRRLRALLREKEEG